MMEVLGEKTRLRPLEERDLDQRAAWISDPEIAELMGAKKHPDDPKTPEEWQMHVRRWFRSRKASRSVYLFAIEDMSGKLIGDIDFQAVSITEGMGWLSIEIGDRDYWGKGYGTDAVRSLLRFAFRRLGMRQVRLNVKKFNVRAIRCYEKCGFVKEGEKKEEYFMVAMAESCDI